MNTNTDYVTVCCFSWHRLLRRTLQRSERELSFSNSQYSYAILSNGNSLFEVNILNGVQ